VGYFYGFDINYFSFFTLNEHIVFALQQAGEAQHAAASHIIRSDKGENSRAGVLLKAGELGLLFFDAATRQVTMIRWDGVTEVVTKKACRRSASLISVAVGSTKREEGSIGAGFVNRPGNHRLGE
jgi:hypothetical protein